MTWTRVTVPVETRAPTGRTAAYFRGDTQALLVDPPARSDALDRAVDERTVAHVAVTHHHPDHVGAVADYAAETGATVWARRGRTDAFEAATGVSPDRTFSPGTTIPTDDGPVTVIDTPGHAPEHVAFAAGDGLVVGDLAVAEGSVVVAPPEGDMRAYLTSLRRVHASRPDRLYPGHGPVVDDPRAACRRLLAHRLDRERRIREAVRGGAETVDEILAAAYDKDLDGVRDLARGTVRAHLRKLVVERAVEWDGCRARATAEQGGNRR